MKKSKLPKTASIEKSAEFWATHDGTDFTNEREEVAKSACGISQQSKQRRRVVSQPALVAIGAQN
jgi:hypothetical protein